MNNCKNQTVGGNKSNRYKEYKVINKDQNVGSKTTLVDHMKDSWISQKHDHYFIDIQYLRYII